MERRGGWHARMMRVVAAWTALSHVPWVVALALAIRDRVGWTAWLVATVAWIGCMFALRPMLDATLPDWKRPRWRVVLERIYLAHWAAVHAVAPGWLLGVLAWWLGRGAPWWWALGSYFAALAVMLWGAFVTPARLVIRRRVLPIAGLPPSFDGYQIMHLSDLHIGSFTTPSRVARWMARLTNERTDLIVVTGDLVTSGTAFHHDIAETIGVLDSPDGVLLILGNHDYFDDGEPMLSELSKRGIRTLRNEHVCIERGDQRVVVAGVEDPRSGREDLEAALRRRPRGTTILLAHDPAWFDQTPNDVDLVLSGHTHGGQVAVPGLARWINLTRLSHPYTLGVYRRGGTTMVVSGGMGCTGLPIRVGVPPEVLVLRLVRA